MEAVPDALNVTAIFWHETTGGCGLVTVTLKLQVLVLAPDVTEYVTTVMPAV